MRAVKQQIEIDLHITLDVPILINEQRIDETVATASTLLREKLSRAFQQMAATITDVKVSRPTVK